VHLRTADLEKQLKFYRDVLGLKRLERTGPVASLSPTGEAAPFLVLTEDREARPHSARTTGLYHFAVRYPSRRDLAIAFFRLARRDYPIEGASDHLVSEAIYLSDPEGNGVELYTDRPRSQWIWHDGQVEMQTKALDLDNLLSTAKGQSEESGPPPQTNISHIHLQVADLAEAERFYHDFVGLAVTQRSYPGALFFAAGGYHHHIASNTWAGKTRPQANSVGLISYRLEMQGGEDFGTLHNRARSAGYEAEIKSEGGQAILQIGDPNRNWLEISVS
jgi:catechol 2,3-dioxygenase